jgi:hypothetical protein
MQRKTKTTTTTTTNATATHDGKRTQHTESGHSYSRSASQNTVRNLSQAGKERTKERERTNERTERNGTEDGHGSTATSSRCGAGSSRVTGRTGCETSATGSPGCFWPGILPLTWRHAVIHHSSTRPQSDPNLSYLIVSPLSDRSLEGLQPHLLGLHHGNLVGRPLNRLPPSGGSGIRVSVPWPQGHWRGPPATLRFFAPYHCASPLLRRVWE